MGSFPASMTSYKIAGAVVKYFEDQGCDKVDIVEVTNNPSGSQVAIFDAPLSVLYNVEGSGKFPLLVKGENKPLFVQVGFAHSKLGSAEKAAADFKRRFVPESRMPILDDVSTGLQQQLQLQQQQQQLQQQHQQQLHQQQLRQQQLQQQLLQQQIQQQQSLQLPNSQQLLTTQPFGNSAANTGHGQLLPSYGTVQPQQSQNQSLETIALNLLDVIRQEGCKI